MMHARLANHTKHNVTAIDIAGLVKLCVEQRRFVPSNATAQTTQSGAGSGNVVMKMDIEGQEIYVLPRMVETGAMCLVALAYIEYHDKSKQGFFSHTQIQWLQNMSHKWQGSL